MVLYLPPTLTGAQTFLPILRAAQLPAGSDHHNSHLPLQTRDHQKWNIPLHLTFSCRNTLNMYKDCTFSFIDFRRYSTWKQQNMDFRSCQTLNLLLFWVPKHAGLREHQKQSYSYMLRIQKIQERIQVFVKFPRSDFCLFVHLLCRLLRDSIFSALSFEY